MVFLLAIVSTAVFWSVVVAGVTWLVASAVRWNKILALAAVETALIGIGGLIGLGWLSVPFLAVAVSIGATTAVAGNAIDPGGRVLLLVLLPALVANLSAFIFFALMSGGGV